MTARAVVESESGLGDEAGTGIIGVTSIVGFQPTNAKPGEPV